MGIFDKLLGSRLKSQSKTETGEAPCQHKADNPGPVQANASVVTPKEFSRKGNVLRNPIDYRDETAVLSLTQYAVIDVETTGLNYFSDKIIEIGIVTVDNGEVNQFTSYVDPERHIPTSASEITGIYDQDVKGAPKYPEIASTIRDVINGFPLIAHNASFDISFLEYLFRPNGIDIELTYLDTLSLSRRYIKGLENYKLGTLVDHFGIDLSNAHRAGDDAYATMQMFECIKKEMVEQKEREKTEKKAEKERIKAERASRYGGSPLYDTSFVFTGEFISDRAYLEHLLETVGAILRDKVTSKTHYLVVGKTENLPAWALERKLGKAQELNAAGKGPKLISEAEYFQLIHQAEECLFSD